MKTNAMILQGRGKGKGPLYRQLCDAIKKQINEGLYRDGDKLPTEKELCMIYGISRATVRRMLVELQKENVLISRQGSGIFVSSHLFEQSLQKFYSFSKEMRQQGKQPGNQILSFERIIGLPKICQTMHYPSQTRLIRIVRLRLADDVVCMHETSYLPATKLLDFTQAQFENHDLYELMSQDYNIVFSRAQESFRPILPSALVASYLKVGTQEPCMYLTRLTYSLNEVVEYTQSIVRGDKFAFTVELKN